MATRCAYPDHHYTFADIPPLIALRAGNFDRGRSATGLLEASAKQSAPSSAASAIIPIANIRAAASVRVMVRILFLLRPCYQEDNAFEPGVFQKLDKLEPSLLDRPMRSA
jgi:hypothetical protein